MATSCHANCDITAGERALGLLGAALRLVGAGADASSRAGRRSTRPARALTCTRRVAILSKERKGLAIRLTFHEHHPPSCGRIRDTGARAAPQRKRCRQSGARCRLRRVARPRTLERARAITLFRGRANPQRRSSERQSLQHDRPERNLCRCAALQPIEPPSRAGTRDCAARNRQ